MDSVPEASRTDLTFPYANDYPPELSEFSVDALIARAVSLDLQLPERRVRARSYVAARAPVPEAAVNEERNSPLTPDEVGTPWERRMATPTRDMPVSKVPGNSKFRCAISEASNRGHVPVHFIA